MLAQMVRQRVEHVRSSLQELFSGRAQIAPHCSVKLDVRNGHAIYAYVTCEFTCSSGDVDRLAGWIAGESGYGDLAVMMNPKGEVVGGRIEVSYDLRVLKEEGHAKGNRD
jgi:pimeloyl-CoA synthetase